MVKNIGLIDIIIRLILAVVIAGIGIYLKSYLGLLAVVPLLTALSGWCPLYLILGLSTCSKKE